MALLTATNLVKSYSGRKVVDEVCLEVNAGEIIGLLGPNGAGKTTSFRMMIGMIYQLICFYNYHQCLMLVCYGDI